MKALKQKKRSSALVIVLAAIALITGLVVALLIAVRFERSSSHLALDHAQSELFADLAADAAIAKLRGAIDAGRQPGGHTWSSEPGRIRVFNFASPVDVLGGAGQQDFDMFSKLPDPDDPKYPEQNNVDLNRGSLRGTAANPMHPITGNVDATMKIGWIPLPRDPSKAASKDNPIIGRIAFWVDDESCKVNINVADGSAKVNTFNVGFSTADATKLKGSFTGGTMGGASAYFGFGTPSEISLAPLINSGAVAGSDAGYQTIAHEIAKYAWNKGFNSPAEVTRVATLPSTFYEANKFNITHTAKSPDINMFGEPKIYLFPSTTGGITLLTGPYGSQREASIGLVHTPPTTLGKLIDFIYPLSKQLPTGTGGSLVQYPGTPEMQFNGVGPATTPSSPPTASLSDRIGRRLADYLGNNLNSQGQPIVWPRFSGSVDGFNADSAGHTGKYTARQLDSIILQIIDMSSKDPLADQARFVLPSIMQQGWLSNKVVSGVGRTPKLTEILVALVKGKVVSGSTTKPEDLFNFSSTKFRVKLVTEFYMPKGYRGTPYHSPYLTCALGGSSPTTRFFFGSGGNSGAPDGNVFANPAIFPLSGVPTPPNIAMGGFGSAAGTQSYFPGGYRAMSNVGLDKTGVAATGGSPRISIRTAQGGGGSGTPVNWNWRQYDFTPLSSLISPYTDSSTAQGADPMAGIPVNGAAGLTADNAWVGHANDPLVNKFPGDWTGTTFPVTTVTDIEKLSNSTLKVPNYAPAGGASATNYFGKGKAEIKTGGFPGSSFFAFGDWTTTASTITTGDSVGYLASGGGDPLSVWIPRVDDCGGVGVPLLTKMSRFPSVGALNYIRTGIIPDDEVGVLDSQHGTPWRSISFDKFDKGTGMGQVTTHGAYPDWAMLDLMTVPFVPQPAYFDTQAAQPTRLLTYGGATEGRLNINNPTIPYPFSLPAVQTIDQTSPRRTATLEALFYGLQQASQCPTSADWAKCYDSSAVDGQFNAVVHAPLALAVGNYVQNNGPFILPGQLAEVPEIAAYTYRGVTLDPAKFPNSHGAESRNDVMRDVVGAITTQSNTYSVWVVAQTIAKNPGSNANEVDFSKGDKVTGETRRHYLVERFIETGTDGVPGSGTAGNIVTTEAANIDGDMASQQPTPGKNPSMSYPLPYRWRLVSVEDVK